jgi:hypothetical protein
MNSFQVVLEKIFLNNFLLSEEITSAFPKLLGNCSWVLGQCMLSVDNMLTVDNMMLSDNMLLVSVSIMLSDDMLFTDNMKSDNVMLSADNILSDNTL